ncbi:MAG: DoxX family protein [Bacteroidetes bacterium]|nr:DoxX family protein [Bacteroidota bacterium]
MKKLLSTNYSETGFNIATLLLRASFGILIFLNHGVSKLTRFGELQHSFLDPMHIGHRWSLLMNLFAEIICALLLVLGLFTRLAAFVLVISMAVAVFIFHRSQSIGQSEMAILYLVVFFSILLLGPGKYSVDAMTGH